MGWLEHRIPPPVVALLLGLAMWWLAPSLPRAGLPQGLRIGLVVLLVVAGLGLSGAAKLQFTRARTTVNPLRPQNVSALVTGGVYRFTRNPMYVGMALGLAAWAVWLASPVELVGPLVFVVYIGRFQIAPEERVIAQRFGADFDAYRARVRRWL